MNRAELERRAQLWRRHRALRAALVALTAGLLAASALAHFSVIRAAVAGVVAAVAAWIMLRRRASPVTAATVAAHLDRLCPVLEDSASLWLRDPDSLHLVERLQRRRLDAAWAELPDRATLGCPPVRALRLPTSACALACVAFAAALVWPTSSKPGSAAVASAQTVSTRPPRIEPSLLSASLAIEPPAYLRQPARRVAGLDADVAEGSAVTWELEFAGDVAGVALSGGDQRDALIAESRAAGRFRAHALIPDTRLYQLEVTRHDGTRTRWPQVHALKAIRDLPPRLTWQEPAASRTLVDPAGQSAVRISLAATDDHGLAGAHLVMTVAKGTGEAVKFREQIAALDRRPDPAGGELFSRTLDLAALGLEPGDELYFHALATDSRAPTPNVARSETRFLVLRGPATELAEPGTAIAGVTLVPQYFRSQRQLIIDTERLLAEQPRLTQEQFRARSEEIGIDQKLLRLRYGQFLGEELEADGAGAPREAQALAFAGRLRTSRADAARAAAIERAVEQQHAHDAAPPRAGEPATVEQLRAPFVHQHDSAEAATLFDLEVKASLRGVLAAMWDAEGLLRSAQPAAALPAENRALELLKALQQADRVYVRRVGFEPAPLKLDERRLRGELGGIAPRASVAVPVAPPDPASAALRAGLGLLGHRSPDVWPPATAAAIDTRLTAAASAQPDKFVPSLEVWRRRSAGLTGADEATLRKAFWSILPSAQAAPDRRDDTAPSLTRGYLEALGSATGSTP